MKIGMFSSDLFLCSFWGLWFVALLNYTGLYWEFPNILSNTETSVDNVLRYFYLGVTNGKASVQSSLTSNCLSGS